MNAKLRQKAQENRYELLTTIQEMRQKRHIINVLCTKHYMKYNQIWQSKLAFPLPDLVKILEKRQYYNYAAQIPKEVLQSEQEIIAHIDSYINMQAWVKVLIRERSKIFKEIAIEAKKQ